ncbi:MAG: hypothetical protein L3J76_01405, partial [Candidatus Hydrothermae bacterium]|nr:hypothetical protein [Candidatus Hydrothermae bacterium]
TAAATMKGETTGEMKVTTMEEIMKMKAMTDSHPFRAPILQIAKVGAAPKGAPVGKMHPGVSGNNFAYDEMKIFGRRTPTV